MKLFGTSFYLDKKYVRLFVILLILGLLLGFLLYQKTDPSFFVDDIKNIGSYLQDTRINFIFTHFLVVAILLFLAFTGVGLLLFPVLMIFEIVCLSFSIFSFGYVFGFPGIIYGLFYNFVIKFIYLVLLFILMKNIYKIVKNIFSYCVLKKELDSILLKKQFKLLFLIIFLIFINDLIIYFVAHSFLYKLCFIIR